LKAEASKLRRTLKAPVLSGIMFLESSASWPPGPDSEGKSLNVTDVGSVIGVASLLTNLPWKFICWGIA
jgi:hypothetical protein